MAALRQRDAAAVPGEERLLQLHLEAAHLLAERRLVDGELDRRPGEAARIRHADEIAKLLEVHMLTNNSSMEYQLV